MIDEAKNTINVHTDGWSGGREPPSIADALRSVEAGPEEPELTVAGQTEGLQFQETALLVVSLAGDEQRVYNDFDQELRIEEGSFVVQVDTHIETAVRFDAPATVRTEAGMVCLEFADSRPVSLGFASRVGQPDETIVIPRTPAGVARGLTALSVANEETSPDRTWPSVRNQPPRLDFGEATHVPTDISQRRPETNVELVVPPELAYLVTSASLVHYLGARVTVEAGADPVLNLDGRKVPLPGLPEFQRRTAALLRRFFHLDCLARTAGPHSGELSIQDTREELDLDIHRLYETPLAERAKTYLDTPYRAVAGSFPEWHFTMHVAPEYGHARTLPYLLDTLPQFLLPESTELSKKEWLRLTVSDGYESLGRPDTDPDATTRVRRELSNVELVKPRLGPGRTHGWMAPKVPIDVFKTLPEAYENRGKYLDDAGTKLSVVAVVNDSGRSDLGLSDAAEANMRDEHEEIVSHYKRRSTEFDVDLTLRENVSTAELGRIFEARNDLVHFIGHRDDRGLECVNGYFSTSTIRESNAQTFFLNACGSYPEGKSLVQNGSVGGGVTFESVTNDDAVRVGTAFARLIVNGFCIERALDYTRRQLMTPKDYAVVGDGTHVLTQNDAFVAPGLFLFRDGGNQFSLLYEQSAPWMTGGEARTPLDDVSYLQGTDRFYELSRERLIEFLTDHTGPIVFEEELRWPENIREQLQSE